MAISGSANQKPQPPQPKAISSSLYKAILVVVIAALLPFFPSQAPEFVNQSILSRGWELIHLLFVGIAISYGLFSRRNSDPEPDKDTHQKPADTPHSYVSRLLHVSSVFDVDDDDDVAPPTDGKIQTWSSQYHHRDPVVVVGNGDTTTPPLCLPVRSLTVDEAGSSGSLDEAKAKEGVVLPSPIPWRSRSGRMEVKDEVVAATVTAPLPPKIPSFRPPAPRPGPPSTPSPEVRPKTSEDSVKKKRFYKSTPPPPPPPPPPLVHGLLHVHDRREAWKSFKDELMDHTKPRNYGLEVPPVAPRSVRTVRWKEEPDVAELPEEEPPLPQRSKEKKGEIPDEVIMASEEDDSDSDSGEESSEAEDSPSSVMPNEYEVDKKADEFIAKFREQIRLQRIESIKRSSRHRSLRKP